MDRIPQTQKFSDFSETLNQKPEPLNAKPRDPRPETQNPATPHSQKPGTPKPQSQKPYTQKPQIFSCLKQAWTAACFFS